MSIDVAAGDRDIRTVHSTQYPWIERDLQPEPERAAAGKRRSDGCEWRTMDEHPSGSWSTIRIQDAEGRCVLGETCSFWPVLTRSGSTGGERLSCLGRLEPCGGARRWQTAAEIRCFRQKLHGRASRLPCSRPRSVCGYMLPRGRLEGGADEGAWAERSDEAGVLRPQSDGQSQPSVGGQGRQRIDVPRASTPSSGGLLTSAVVRGTAAVMVISDGACGSEPTDCQCPAI
jgi:hypothetical protein